MTILSQNQVLDPNTDNFRICPLSEILPMT